MTGDEAAYGVKYRAEADFRVLGKKLKKDMQRVKNALPGNTLFISLMRLYLPIISD